MTTKIDERGLEANLITYLDERLEALKKHDEIHGKWISTNKKIVDNSDDYWFIIGDLINEIWESAIEKFNCRKLMVYEPEWYTKTHSTGYPDMETSLGHHFYELVREKVESLFNIIEREDESW